MVVLLVARVDALALLVSRASIGARLPLFRFRGRSLSSNGNVLGGHELELTLSSIDDTCDGLKLVDGVLFEWLHC